MLGVSKYNKKIDLSKRKLSKLITSATKRVNAATAQKIDVIFCNNCSLPAYKDDVYIATDGNDKPTVLCSLCYFPQNLDMVSFSDSGTLIFAPDFTQEQINALALMTYYIKNNADDNRDVLDLVSDIDDLILRRTDVLNTGICHGASSPSIVCQFLYMMDENDYLDRHKMFSSIRLFPSERLCRRQLSYLSTNILKKYHFDKWIGLVQAIEKEIK